MAAAMSMTRAFAAPTKAFRPARSARLAVVYRAAARTVKPVKKTVKSVEQSSAKKPVFQLGFTSSNELFVGRLAMLGFASSLIGEVLTGKGALAQFGYEIGLNTSQVDVFIVGLIAFNAVAALLPTSGTFVPDPEVESRPAGPLQDPTISLLNPKKFFSFKSFGFTKENELFVGRTAQLGFAASILGEYLTGKGPLAQFDFETGVNLFDTEFGLLAFIGFFLLAAVNEGTGKFVDEE